MNISNISSSETPQSVSEPNMSLTSSSSFEQLCSTECDDSYELIGDSKNITDFLAEKPPKIINNTADPTIILPDYVSDPKGFFNVLLAEVNRKGKAPVLLRLVAFFLSNVLKIHGFGQTNCLSCATSVGESYRDKILHRAEPKLRGASPANFASINSSSGLCLASINSVSEAINKADSLNAVITINRPKAWYRKFSGVDGHACNIIKSGNRIYLIDAQKNIFKSVEMEPDSTASKEQLLSELKNFIDAVAEDELSIKLYSINE